MTSVQLQNDPIMRLPFLYIGGMNVAYASGTVIGISPGQCRDSTDSLDMPVGYPNSAGVSLPAELYQGYQPGLLLDCTKNGANGLDTGVLQSASWYAVYVIGDSRNILPVAGIVTLSAQDGPLLPGGYDSYRLIAFVATSISSVFDYTYVKPINLKKAITYVNQAPINVLVNGHATTFTFIDLTTNSAVPASQPFLIVTLYITFTPSRVGDFYQLENETGVTNSPLTIMGGAPGVTQGQYVTVLTGPASVNPGIYYLVSSANSAVDISVVSWTGANSTVYPVLV